MGLQSLIERLRAIFSTTYKSEIEEFIVSKNPQSASDVEHWLRHYTYHNNNWFPNA